MSDWQQPAWLRKALDARDVTPVPFPDDAGPRRVEAGEIRAARPMDGGEGSRIVLILEGSSPDWANTMLLTNLVEAATHRDVRLDSEETRLAFSVLAETDILGPMFVAQFGPLLGRVNEDLIENLHVVRRGEDSLILAGRRGVSVLSRNEHRVRWKEDELAAMHRLAGDCFAELLRKDDSRAPILADPAFFEDLEDTAPAEIVSRLLELAKVSHLDVPAESMSSAAGLRSWIAQLDPGEMAALEPIWRGALRESDSGSATAQTAEWKPARSSGQRILQECVVARVSKGERSIPIATRSDFWEVDVHEGIVKVTLADGRLAQLSPIVLTKRAA